MSNPPDQLGLAASPPPEPPPQDGEKKASWIVRVSIYNPYAVIVMALFIIVIGYVCLTRIPVDLLPAYRTPAVQVLTLYPGMPSEFVDRGMTWRLERWLSQAEGIQRQESRSMIGVSIIKNYFRDDIDSNTAMSQISALAISDMYYLPPGTIPPMTMLFDPTATLPTALVASSSETLNETQVYDLSYFNVRNMLSGTPGVIAPAVFGGRLRRIYVYLDRDKLQAYNLSLTDVQRAIKESNLLIPTGDAKFGDKDYMINLENMMPKVEDFAKIPIKVANGQPVLVRDVGEVKDTYAIQTNAVRISEPSSDPKVNWKSKRQVYIPIFRRPGANTIQVVEGIKRRIPEYKSPPARPRTRGVEHEGGGGPVGLRAQEHQQLVVGSWVGGGAGQRDDRGFPGQRPFDRRDRLDDPSLGARGGDRPLFHRSHAERDDARWTGPGDGPVGG